jgi:hypothetical protein
MDGIIVFQNNNDHPLSGLLKGGFRHVWCATRDPKRGWAGYDWRSGCPSLTVLAGPDFDLAVFYRAEGYTVLEIECGTTPSALPLTLNNCVGHTKIVMGIRCFALTPYQLYKHFTKERRPMWDRIKHLFRLPGFGGSAPAVPAAPAPPAAPPEKADPAVQQARRDEQKRAKLRAGQGGTIKTPAMGVGDAITTKTLLGQ